MEKEIEHLQGKLSILSELERGINVKGKMCRKLKRKYKLEEENIITVKQTVKQRMHLKVQRRKRYEKRVKCYRQNLILKMMQGNYIERLEKESKSK